MDFQGFIVQIWENYGAGVLGIFRRILVIGFIIAAGKIAIYLSKRMTRKDAVAKFKADETFVSVLRVVIHYGVVIICIIMILDVLGVSTTSLIALLGAAGVAVGFALRDTLSNIAAGIVILFLHPFRKGEFIECDNVLGTVTDMGLFATELTTADGVYISVPNSNLWGMPLRNYSRNPTRRMDITVSVSYANSIDTVFQALRTIIEQEPRFLKDPPPQVMVQSLGESGIGITLRAWVPGSSYWPLYWEHMKVVKERVEEAGVTIAFPRRNIQLVNNSGNGTHDSGHTHSV